MALATLSELKEYLDISSAAHDARLTSLLARAESAMEQFTERRFAAADYVELNDGAGVPWLLLRHYPALSVASVHDDTARAFPPDTLIPAADYALEADAGILRLTSGGVFTRGVSNVRAAYRAGYETPPSDLKQACILFAALLFEERKNVGVASRSLKDGATTYRHGIPEEVLKMLEPYRRRSIG